MTKHEEITTRILCAMIRREVTGFMDTSGNRVKMSELAAVAEFGAREVVSLCDASKRERIDGHGPS